MLTPTILNQLSGRTAEIDYKTRSWLKTAMRSRKLNGGTVAIFMHDLWNFLIFRLFKIFKKKKGKGPRMRNVALRFQVSGDVGRRGKPSTWLPRPKLAEERIIEPQNLHFFSQFFVKICSWHFCQYLFAKIFCEHFLVPIIFVRIVFFHLFFSVFFQGTRCGR